MSIIDGELREKNKRLLERRKRGLFDRGEKQTKREWMDA